MNQILPHRLWVGHAGDCRNFRALLDAGIEAVVQLAVADERGVTAPHKVLSCRFPLVDEMGSRPEHLALAIQTVAAFVRLRIPTLVFCGSGMTLSPPIVAAALSVVTGRPPDECLKLVIGKQPIDVTPEWWDEVKEAIDPVQPPPVGERGATHS
jgi:hypothetical protein